MVSMYTISQVQFQLSLSFVFLAITHFDKFGKDFGEIIRTTNKQTNRRENV